VGVPQRQQPLFVLLAIGPQRRTAMVLHQLNLPFQVFVVVVHPCHFLFQRAYDVPRLRQRFRPGLRLQKHHPCPQSRVVGFQGHFKIMVVVAGKKIMLSGKKKLRCQEK